MTCRRCATRAAVAGHARDAACGRRKLLVVRHETRGVDRGIMDALEAVTGLQCDRMARWDERPAVQRALSNGRGPNRSRRDSLRRTDVRNANASFISWILRVRTAMDVRAQGILRVSKWISESAEGSSPYAGTATVAPPVGGLLRRDVFSRAALRRFPVALR